MQQKILLDTVDKFWTITKEQEFDEYIFKIS